MENKSDTYFIDRVLNGDVNAYSFLVEKHKDMVFTVALKITGNREDAEEIAQDAFIKVYSSLKDFRHKSKFTTWIYQIVYNAAISRVRKKKTEKVSISNELAENYTLDDIVENLDILEREEQKKLVDEAIEALEPQEKMLIELYYAGETPVNEIADITGLSASNVKVKLFRIRNKMHRILQQLMRDELKTLKS